MVFLLSQLKGVSKHDADIKYSEEYFPQLYRKAIENRKIALEHMSDDNRKLAEQIDSESDKLYEFNKKKSLPFNLNPNANIFIPGTSMGGKKIKKNKKTKKTKKIEKLKKSKKTRKNKTK